MRTLLVGCLLLASRQRFCFFEQPLLYASAMEVFDPAFSLGFLLKCLQYINPCASFLGITCMSI